MLGTELRSSGRAASALNRWPLLQSLHLILETGSLHEIGDLNLNFLLDWLTCEDALFPPPSPGVTAPTHTWLLSGARVWDSGPHDV